MNVASRLDLTFAALADPTRRAILARLADGEATVAELGRPFAMSQPAISKHLRMLERAGLISAGQDAQRRPRRLEGRSLAAASAWLERYRRIWESSYQRLDALLEEMQSDRRDSAPASAHSSSQSSRPRRSRAGTRKRTPTNDRSRR